MNRTNVAKPVGMKLGWRALLIAVIVWVPVVGGTMLG